MQIHLALSNELLSTLWKLPGRVHKKIDSFLKAFPKNPKDKRFNFERIRGGADPRYRSARIDQNYRAILLQPQKGNTLVIVYIDHHDKAYEWSCQKRALIHSDTGTVRIYSVTREPETTHESVATRPGSLFRNLRDRQLRRVGVPDELLPLVRTFLTKTDLQDHEANLPGLAWEALDFLSDDIDYHEVVDYIDAERRAVPDEVDAVLRRAAFHGFDILDDDLGVQAMLHAPLDRWRAFLHPSLLRFAAKRAGGPLRLSGEAGTGTSAAAMYRAKHLAETVFTDPEDRILFAVDTPDRAADIAASLRLVCSDSALARIEVVDFKRWVAELVRETRAPFRLADDGDRDAAWANAFAETEELPYPRSFYRQEFRLVVLPLGIDRDDYLKVGRKGRGRRLGRKARSRVWEVFERYRGRLEAFGRRELEDACRELRAFAAETELPYRAAVLDQAQNLGAEALRLVRHVIPDDRGDDLFIVEDPYGRIADLSPNLIRCGIRVRGRSGRRLRIGYRAPDDIRLRAVGLLRGASLEAPKPPQGEVHSVLSGKAFDARQFAGFQEEVAGLVERLKSSAGELRGTCIVARTESLTHRYAGALLSRGIGVCVLRPGEAEDRSIPGVRMAAMERARGLAFDHVIVAGMNADTVPLHRDASDSEERLLLYQVLSRARRSVFVTGWGDPSPLLRTPDAA